MQELTLENSELKALVGDEDYPRLLSIKWYLGPHGYAYGYFGYQRKRLLHRFLLSLTNTNEHVDHINGDRLDCRRCNMRVCTNQQNTFNGKRRSTNKSGFKGVCWTPRFNKWRATITKDGRQTHIGYYEQAEDAARAYDKAAVELFGEFAKLNFPGEDTSSFKDNIKRKTRPGRVYKSKNGRWYASFMKNGQRRWVGVFDTQDEAFAAIESALGAMQCQVQ